MNPDPAPDRSSAGWLAVLLAAAVAAVALFPLATTAAPPPVAIQDVSISTEQPAPGQLTEIRTTIANAGNRTGPIEITDVYVRERDGSGEIARVEDLGSVPAGGTLTVPMMVSFDEPGVRTLRITVVAETGDGEFVSIQHPRTVVVREGGPQLNVDVDDPTVGGDTAVTVNVSNGERSEIRSLDLRLEGSNVRVENPLRLAAGIDAGSEQSFTYTATFPEAERSTVGATLEYTTTEGETRTVRRSTAVYPAATAEFGERPQVELSVPDALPGATRPVNVTVANGLDHEIRQLRVLTDSPAADVAVSERVRARLAAGEQTTFRFPASVEEAGTYPVNVTLVYAADGVQRRVSRTYRANFGAPTNPGEITLTGVQAVERGGELEISATAGNVGSGSVEGVVVSTGDAENVQSADYFVGSVEGSDFSSFTLTTSTTGNVSSVPVEVRYVVGGVEKSFTTDVPVRQVTVREPRTSGGGGGPPLTLIGGVVVLLVVAGLAYRRWG